MVCSEDSARSLIPVPGSLAWFLGKCCVYCFTLCGHMRWQIPRLHRGLWGIRICSMAGRYCLILPPLGCCVHSCVTGLAPHLQEAPRPLLGAPSQLLAEMVLWAMMQPACVSDVASIPKISFSKEGEKCGICLKGSESCF